MEVQNCTDINGVALSEVLFNDDGTVVGIIETSGGTATSRLSCACCEAQGWTFDPNEAKCYWATTCLEGGNYSIVLDPQGNSGALFQVDENQQGNCTLELTFDWLIRFDCSKIQTPIRQLIEELELTVHIEKVVYNESLPIPNNLESVASQTMFSVDNIFTFLDGNENTGLILENVDGSSSICNPIYQRFLNDLSPNSSVVNDFSLNSDWVSFRLEITDPEILESIYNERLKISIEGNSLANYSIIIDDVKLNRLCEVTQQSPYLDDECPKFNLKRVIDNKKSWVENDTVVLRNFDLERRLTNYTINEEKLSINTKEIDLGINPSQAVSNDVFQNIIDNPCLLSPATGCTSGDTTHDCVDLTPLVTVPLTELEDDNELLNMLIDAKSRKTLRGYPVIDLIYHRYRNALEHCGVQTNIINDVDLDNFITLLGTYWSDLIEQLVPATTIWGASLTSGQSPLTSGNNKFRYRRYSSFPCYGNDITTAPSPVNGDYVVSVITEDISDNVLSASVPRAVLSNNILTVPNRISTASFTTKRVTKCNLLSISQSNDGSEFLGSVTVIGDGEGPSTGSTISITETIEGPCVNADFDPFSLTVFDSFAGTYGTKAYLNEGVGIGESDYTGDYTTLLGESFPLIWNPVGFEPNIVTLNSVTWEPSASGDTFIDNYGPANDDYPGTVMTGDTYQPNYLLQVGNVSTQVTYDFTMGLTNTSANSVLTLNITATDTCKNISVTKDVVITLLGG